MLLNYQKIARLILPIDPMPQGALPLYIREPEGETMIPGTIVELELNKPANKWKAQPGARAEVVDKRRFPDLHNQLEEYLRNFGEPEKDMEEFIFVVWDRNDPKWNGQPDGAYTKYRFRVIGAAQEPKNNDGRSTCFWCGGKTENKQGFTNSYDICPKCGK